MVDSIIPVKWTIHNSGYIWHYPIQCFSWLSTNTAIYSVVWGTGQRGTPLLICKGIENSSSSGFQQSSSYSAPSVNLLSMIKQNTFFSHPFPLWLDFSFCFKRSPILAAVHSRTAGCSTALHTALCTSVSLVLDG